VWSKEAKAASAPKVRLVAMEMVHGCAGSTKFGVSKNLWAPEKIGRDFDLSQTSLSSLEPFKNDVTVVSNTDLRQRRGVHAAGNRRRSLPRQRRCS
jgi:hypothetical protein